MQHLAVVALPTCWCLNARVGPVAFCRPMNDRRGHGIAAARMTARNHFAAGADSTWPRVPANWVVSATVRGGAGDRANSSSSAAFGLMTTVRFLRSAGTFTGMRVCIVMARSSNFVCGSSHTEPLAYFVGAQSTSSAPPFNPART